MTLTDAMVAAAALWLLFVLSGIPGQRPGAPSRSAETTASVASPHAPIVAVPYSVWYQEVPQPRFVTPPLPGAGTPEVSTIGETIPESNCRTLGSTAIFAAGLPQTLSLTEITIPPGGRLTLADLDASGLLVLQSGWLELTARDGNARLISAPWAESAAPQADPRAPTVAPGDRIAFAPGATIALRNRAENAARMLAVTVMAPPGHLA